MKKYQPFLERSRLKEISESVATTADWTPEQAEGVVSLILQACAQVMDNRAVRIAAKVRKAKGLAARELMERYRELQLTIKYGTDSAIKLMDDTEMQRLMDREEAVKSQKVTSVALKAAGDRVLWLRLNAALEELDDFCEDHPDPKKRRAYSLLYDRYINPQKMTGVEIAAKHHIESTVMYDGINIGLELLGQILFGIDSAAEFVLGH